jgi:hypothetical protein
VLVNYTQLIQYVSIISDVRFNNVYSYLLVLSVYVKCVIITTVEINVFFNTRKLRKCETNETECSHYDSRYQSILKNTFLHNAGACCMVNWRKHRLYLCVQMTDPVYGESKHRNQHKKVKQEICAMRVKENV